MNILFSWTMILLKVLLAFLILMFLPLIMFSAFWLLPWIGKCLERTTPFRTLYLSHLGLSDKTQNPCNIWDILILKNCSLFTWNSNLMRHPIILFAKSGDLNLIAYPFSPESGPSRHRNLSSSLMPSNPWCFLLCLLFVYPLSSCYKHRCRSYTSYSIIARSDS